ncbi:MAG TPA: sugar ABC transporter ATP-binding protein [Vicinamibacterales bacterium]|jgi:ribose transport system ATP-binding protein|nr:sugar ABC transporter ATP-binding protein [Vicinamibacterales bacterium]
MAEVAAPRFEMRGISKAFGATIAVNEIDLAVRAGEVCALVGQNGAGKSTLMSILAGAQSPDAGTMRLDGNPYSPRGPLDARNAGVAMIYQELSLAPHLSVVENIVLGMEPARAGFVRRGAAREAARAALDRLGRADIPLDAPAGSLSVAAQQIVEIARAVAVGSKVLVMDEPTSSLARADTRRLFDVIAGLRRAGHAIVYISHFIEEVKEVADRIVVVRDGRVAGDLPPAAPAEQIVTLMVGRAVADLYPRSERSRGEAILDTDALGEPPSTFTIHRGEILGIAGLVGAGRTRLLRTIFGLERVRNGQVRVGAWVGNPSPAAQLAHGVGMLSEDRKNEGLAMNLQIGENLTMSRTTGLGPGPLVLPAHRDAASRTWIERLGIRCGGPRQTVAELSGGNQQKVALARLLHHDVDVLLLDEPTRGIDVGSKAQIYALLDELVAGKRGRPRAVLLVSSYLPELLGLCDRIAVMRRGRLGAPRPAAGLTEHELMMEATGAEHAA